MKLKIDPNLILPEYPKIPEDCQIIVEEKYIQIHGMEESLSFSGENSLPLLTILLPLLDGQTNIEEIMSKFKKKEHEHVIMILKYLYFKGIFEKYEEKFVEDSTGAADKKYYSRCVDVSRYCNNRNDVFNKIKSFPLLVISNKQMGENLTKEFGNNHFENINWCLLEDSEIQLINQEKLLFDDLLNNNLDEDTHILVAFNRKIPQFFSLVNKFNYERKNYLTISYLTDKSFVIGPTIIPDETACINCLENRRILNSINLDDISIKNNFLNGNQNKPFSHTKYNIQHFYSMLIAEMVNIATFINFPKTIGTELEYNFVYSQLHERNCHRLPSCKICSKKVNTNSYVFMGET